MNKFMGMIAVLLVSIFSLLLASCTIAQPAMSAISPLATVTPTATPSSSVTLDNLAVSLPLWAMCIGGVGGLLGILSSIVTFISMVRNRRRLELRVVSAECYYQLWTQYDVEGAKMPVPGTPSHCIPGAGRRFFTVLEFSVHNQYPYEVSVGRFRIDGWMYADRYLPPMYAYKRQYQVFDLYSQKPISLNSFEKMPAYGSRGIRVEVFEDTSGPHWESSKSRYIVQIPNCYVIEFRSDIRPLSRTKVKLHHIRVGELLNNLLIHRWGDMIGTEPEYNYAGSPVPQGHRNLNLEHDWNPGRWSRRSDLYYWYVRRVRNSKLVIRLNNWWSAKQRKSL